MKQKLTRQQHKHLQTIICRAAMWAFKSHFSGEGSKKRILEFSMRALYLTANWYAGFMIVVSSAVIEGLLIGPNHANLFHQLYAWVLQTPFEGIQATAHAWMTTVAWDAFNVSLIAGIGFSLGRISRPAIIDAEREFRQALSYSA
jgi:hypothetical protein